MRRVWLLSVIALVAACGARSTLSGESDSASGADAGRGDASTHDGGSNPNCHDEIIAKDSNGAISLAVDGNTVFWGNTDGALQVHDASGNRMLVAESPLTISSIAFDDSRVYYTIANELRSVSRAGGSPTTLATGVNYAFALMYDGNAWFMLDRGTGILDGRVLRVDADGSMHELLTDLDIPSGLAMDEDFLYVDAVAAFPDGGNIEGPLYRVAKDGTSVMLLGQGLYGPSSVGLDAAHVYVASQVENGASGPLGSLLEIPKTGGTFTPVITTGQALDLDVTIDGNVGYMTTYAVPGDVSTAAATLLAIPLDGAPSTELATTHHVVYGYVRTSPDAIYWTINWSQGSAPDDGASVRKMCK